MARKEQRVSIQNEREALIKELENLYLKAFERLVTLNLNDSDIAKLTQIFLQSKDGALKPLKNKIEKPLITKSPFQH